MKKLFSLFIFILTMQSMVAQEMLDTVHVSANRANTTLNSANRNVLVINKKQIEQNPNATTNEALESLSGLDVRQRGPLDVQADISVRGGTFDQTLILINGIRLNDPQTGHHNMNLPISLGFVEQINVLQGGASRVYGPNAFAGAIDFVLPTHGKNMLSATVTGGDWGLFSTQVNTAFNMGNWYSIVAANISKSNGYMPNTDFDAKNIFGQTAGKTNIGLLTLNLGYNQKGFGAQNFYSDSYPEQYEATETLFGSAKLTGGKTWKYTAQAYWRQHKDRFELFRETGGPYRFENGYFIKNNTDTAKYVQDAYASWAYYPNHNYHRTRVLGAELQLKREWQKAGTTTFGFDYRKESIVSNNLGKPVTDPILVNGTSSEYDLADARENYAIYAEHILKIKKFSATFGALLNHNSAFGTDVMPGIDLGYRIKPNTLIFASADRSFRQPTFTDLYYSLGGAQGSEDLQPEYSINYEIGFRHSKGIFGATVSVFRREGKDMIDWVEWTPDSIHAENLTALNMNGISADANFFLAKRTENWIKSAGISYTFLTSDGVDLDVPSLYVLDYLSHNFTINVATGFGLEKTSLSLQLIVQDRNGSYKNLNGDDISYEPFALLNAKVSHRIEMFELFVRVQNILDANYIDRGNVRQPGVWASGGLKLDLDF